MHTSGLASAPLAGSASTTPHRSLKLTELRLSGEARVNRFEGKAGFSVAPDHYALDDNMGPDVPGVAADSVIDPTGRVSADGRLDWIVPRGSWTVIRFGYSLIGRMNHPATAEATGLAEAGATIVGPHG